MKKDKKVLYMVLGSFAAVLVGAGLLFTQSEFLMGSVGMIIRCPAGGTSQVASWVPTVLTTFNPPKEGSTKVVSTIPCGYKRVMTKPDVKIGDPVEKKGYPEVNTKDINIRDLNIKK